MLRWYLILPTICLATLLGLRSFLAINHPVKTNVLVVEGWLPEAALAFAARLYRTQQYALLLTNGGKASEPAPKSTGVSTFAELAKNQLVGMGIDGSQIIEIPTRRVEKSRTFSYARSTVDWLIANRKSIKAFNILSLDAHARKSFVLYKKAAGGHGIEVGIISAPPVEYHPHLWFISVYGVGFVIKNLAGYLYALTI